MHRPDVEVGLTSKGSNTFVRRRGYGSFRAVSRCIPLPNLSGGFPWFQLTHLRLVLEAYMAFLLLQMCPNLVSFRGLTGNGVWLTTLEYSTIRHAKLQFLHSPSRGILDRL